MCLHEINLNDIKDHVEFQDNETKKIVTEQIIRKRGNLFESGVKNTDQWIKYIRKKINNEMERARYTWGMVDMLNL